MKFSVLVVVVNFFVLLNILNSIAARHVFEDRNFQLLEYLSDIEQNCKDTQDNYYEYPYDCQKYYSCREGKLFLSTCPDNLYWNNEIHSCGVQSNANCSNILPFPHPNCTTDETTFYIYPYNCRKFYECFQKTLYILDCPDDLVWNDKEKFCDDSFNVDCYYIIPSSVEPDSPTSAPASSSPLTTIPTTPQPTMSSTEAPPETTHAPPPTPSSPLTTVPTTPQPTVSSTSNPPTSTYPSPPTSPPVTCDIGVQYIPDPYNCSKYYECSNGKPISMACPGSEYWSQIKETCDWYYNVDCHYSTLSP